MNMDYWVNRAMQGMGGNTFDQTENIPRDPYEFSYLGNGRQSPSSNSLLGNSQAPRQEYLRPNILSPSSYRDEQVYQRSPKKKTQQENLPYEKDNDYSIVPAVDTGDNTSLYHFADEDSPSDLSNFVRQVDLRIQTAKKARGESPETKSEFSLYEPDPTRAQAPLQGQGGDKTFGRDLHMREAAAADFVDTLDRSSDEIRKNPSSSLVPLTQSYNNLAAFERGLVESGRKMFGSGANFTEFEIQNILKQVGPFFGPSVARQPGAILNPEQRIERLQTAQDLIMNKVDKFFESAGYKRRRVRVTGPDKNVIEVDALEAPRAIRLAKDPERWSQFINSLQN